MIRPVLVLLLSLLCSLPAMALPPDRAGRPEVERLRFEAELEHPLLPAEEGQLRALGLSVVATPAARRVVLRGTDEARQALAATGFVKTTAPLRAADRIAPTAVRELLRSGGAARLSVAFHEDVPFEEALQAIRAAGVWPAGGLVTGFAPARTLDVWAGRIEMQALAQRDQVRNIFGSEGEVESHNSGAALMSGVTAVQAAPYSLNGEGVVVGVMDIGVAQADHPAFEGRVTSHDTGTAAFHPTHVTGTVAAGGTNATARGMAPKATVHQYSYGATSQNSFDRKSDAFLEFPIAVDNNSWGFISGWNYDDTKSKWGWYESDGFGAYTESSQKIDTIVRDRKVLVMFSAGNDGNERGPTSFPFEHVHPYDVDDEITWCMSNDGSGTDCPVATCGDRCEKVKHPSDGTWSNMSRLGGAKNAVAVGAISQGSKTTTSFSSRGPSRDGRIKPDLVAKGLNVFSTGNGGGYSQSNGTSMATPVVTGVAALVVEQWRKTLGATPRPDELKAVLLNGAEDLGTPGPDYAYGFGLVNAQTAVDNVIADAGQGNRIRRGTVRGGDVIEHAFDLAATESVRLTLVWNDPAFDPSGGGYWAHTLINDLNLKVVAPDGSVSLPWVGDAVTPENGSTRGVNDRDTVEQIDMTATVAGTYKAVISGTTPGGPQEYALVASASRLAAAVFSCSDPLEPNDGETQAWGRLLSHSLTGSILCSEVDVDHFRFVADRDGPVSVVVRATGALPLTARLTGGGVPVEVQVPAGGEAILNTTNAGTVSYLVRIGAAAGASGQGTYTLTPSYPSSQANRQRSVRR